MCACLDSFGAYVSVSGEPYVVCTGGCIMHVLLLAASPCVLQFCYMHKDAGDDIRCIGQKLTSHDAIHLRLLLEAW